MAWQWRHELQDGTETSAKGIAAQAFTTQSDAEDWLGENWRELREAGVAQVSLLHDDDVSYGPMSLQDPE